MEVNVPEGTRSKDIKCDLKPKSVCVSVNKEVVIKVWGETIQLEQRKFYKIVHAGKFMGDSSSR